MMDAYILLYMYFESFVTVSCNYEQRKQNYETHYDLFEKQNGLCSQASSIIFFNDEYT